MEILNQTLQFHNLSISDRSAFAQGKATKKKLVSGTHLFRFSGHANISPWWSETKDLPGILLAAKGYGKGLYQYIRDKNAVLRLWNPDMSNLIIVKLTKDVFAFYGTIAPQNEAAKYMDPKDIQNYKRRFTKAVFFGGGNAQVFIPGLSNSDLIYKLPNGVVNVYDDIDSIIECLISYKLI